MSSISDKDLKYHYLHEDTEIASLDCKEAFNALTLKEKHYCHYISKASWYGSLICLYQTSPESPAMFVLLLSLFTAETTEVLRTRAITNCEFTNLEFDNFMLYAAGFFGNLGNYRSFGDTKFIPNVPKEKLSVLFVGSPKSNEISVIWSKICEGIYSLTDRTKIIGMGPKGITTYYSSNCDEQDAKICEEFMTMKNFSAYNTRLFKQCIGTEILYEIVLASSFLNVNNDKTINSFVGTHTNVKLEKALKEYTYSFTVRMGDYSPLMSRLVDNLKEATKYIANENEKNMLNHYILSFEKGCIEEHKEGSRFWIRNKSPIIETYIGFIESYRDPMGFRGEFEGFVAIVNKKQSAKFQKLVSRAEHFLSMLPWPNTYEKDVFLKPDFTSLEVLTFASSGIPAGINIPNYDDIRQDVGFKNVSLGNVLSAGYSDSKVTFLSEQDEVLYKKLKVSSFEVQVGLHELLGHGSGKNFIKYDNGTFNFDVRTVKHMETNELITSWYNEKDTWDTKFSKISSAYEECRAECVGIYLCLSSEVLSIFGHDGNQADDIIYVNWLNMVRAGLLALEFYNADSSTWMQAHMQARYVILRILLEAGQDLVMIKHYAGKAMDNSEANLLITLDRSKINVVGKKAISDFLKKLQLYKSTCDVENANEMFAKYSNVCPDWLIWRDIVIARNQPRKLFSQAHTINKGNEVDIINSDNSREGLIQSMVIRFGDDKNLVNDMIKTWLNDNKYFII